MGTRVASLPRPSTRRWRVLAALVAALVVVAGVAAWLDGRDTGATTTNKDSVSTATLPTRTVEAGAVTVKLAPRQFDVTAAAFKITFDTHSVALDVDVARQARLVVGDTTWPVDGWSGDGPGGHHREGELRFRADGPAAGTATLTLAGLPEPVTATWELGS